MIGDTSTNSVRDATPTEVREAIDRCPENLEIKFLSSLGSTWKCIIPRELFMFTYVTASRIGEVLAKVQPNEKLHSDMRYGVYGDDARVEEYLGEEYLIFKLNVLKRRTPTLKDVAVSLRCEPYARPLLQLFRCKGMGPVFNFSKPYAWKASRQVFQGLSYTVAPYTKIYHGFVFSMASHTHPGSAHFMRHMRLTELGSPPYNFTGEELGKYVKWTASSYGVSSMVERYVRSSWHDYAEKLLVKEASK